MGVVLGLAAAFAFGAADFLGGLASRRNPALLVALANQVISIPVILLVLLAWRPTDVVAGDLVSGAAAGVCSALALGLLYRVLRHGAMGVLVAVTGLMSAVVPFTWALFNGERLTGAGIAGVVVAVVAIVIVSGAPSHAKDVLDHRRHVALAAVAGFVFGIGWMLVVRVSETSGVAPLVSMRVAGALVSAALVARVGAFLLAPGTRWQVALSGLAALGATILFLLASHLDVVAVMSVLQGLAPLATAVLAAVFLHQRMTQTQFYGLVTAVVAVVLLSLN